jgi:hypothetical protein
MVLFPLLGVATVFDADFVRGVANNPGALSKEAMFILTAATVCGYHARYPRGSESQTLFEYRKSSSSGSPLLVTARVVMNREIRLSTGISVCCRIYG